MFIISAVTPIVFGYNVRTSNEKEIQSTAFRDDDLMNSAWPMFQHDVRHTGRSPYGKSGTWRVEKWKLRLTDGTIISSPAIDNNEIIYIGGGWSDECLFAIKPDGTLVWNFKTGGMVQSSPAIAADGTIYVGSSDGNLYAIYPNGTQKWKLSLGSWVFSSPTIGDDGTIYVGSTNNNFYAVNPNGTIKWIFQTGFKVYSSAAIDENGIIYFGSHDNYLYALYPNGTLKWKHGTGDCVKSPPAIGDDGTIYVCSWDCYLYAINPDGTRKWRFNTGNTAETSPTIADDGTIYVGSYNGRIFSIAPDGSENWRFETGDWVVSSPAIDKYGTIYVGSHDGALYALNPDGSLRWVFSTGGKIESSPAIGEDGTIYFGSFVPLSHGDLYAIEIIENKPPDAPTIDGPTNGKVGVEYDYTFNAVDPDGDDVKYHIDWGDGTTTDWIYWWYPSGEPVTVSHTYHIVGYVTISARAKDIYGAIGNESTFTFHIGKSKSIVYSLPLWFLEQFPILQKILIFLTI